MGQARGGVYYGNRNDAWAMWADVLQQFPVDIIVDGWLKSPDDVGRWHDLSPRAKTYLEKRCAFFIVPKNIPVCSENFWRADRGEMIGYYRMERASLCAQLFCTLPGYRAVDDIVRLSGGDIMLQPEYEDSATHLWHSIPESFKELHKQIVKCIRKHCVHRQLIKTKGWVGKEADRLLNEGKAVIADIGA